MKENRNFFKRAKNYFMSNKLVLASLIVMFVLAVVLVKIVFTREIRVQSDNVVNNISQTVSMKEDTIKTNTSTKSDTVENLTKMATEAKAVETVVNDSSESKSDESTKDQITNENQQKEAVTEAVTNIETSSEEQESIPDNVQDAEQNTPDNTAEESSSNDNASDNPDTSGLSKLHVDGRFLKDSAGNVVVLNGVSTHGIAWFPQYVNKDSFATLRDSFDANVVRIAMYSDPGAGYSTAMHSKVEEAVDYATSLGLYVIIDWHILNDGNPNTYKSQAINFFSEMSAKYNNYNNVLYEICNEPNGCNWSQDVKPYAIDVIDTIRANDPDGIIIVGTTTWSQDVDIAADDPITGYSNIMYSLHYYAATHKEWNQNKLITAVNKGLPVFVTEFSICDASGNGANDIDSANTWMQLLNKYNISFVGWNLSNKAESSAIINSSCSKTSGWSDSELSESGSWLVTQLRNH